jgi:hypothetical protein
MLSRKPECEIEFDLFEKNGLGSKKSGGIVFEDGVLRKGVKGFFDAKKRILKP